MKTSVLFALVLAGAVTAQASAAGVPATVSYAPPAGSLPAGRYHGQTFSAVLPSGRLVTPAGASVVTGAGARGLALTPDGRFAIVGNDDPGAGDVHSAIDPGATDGSSLAVVDTGTMTVIARYPAPLGERYDGSVLAVADPARPGQTLVLATGGATDAVYAFTLDAFGHLVPDAAHRIAIAGPTDPAYADLGHSAPESLVASRDGLRAYVVNVAGGSVVAIDLATRRALGSPRPVGYFPSSAALAGDRLVVTNQGMMRYGIAPQPTLAPPFGTPAPALASASSLSLVDLTVAGALVPAGLDTAGISAVPMDPPADGLRIVGGAHPSAIVATPDARYAFVTMTNVDRIATVALDGVPHVAGGTELRLFDRGPYGTKPCALALSRDGSRLYVALRGLDAIAVIDARDPVHLHRLGLIPAGWDPSALALASDDRTLFVANEKGFGHDGGVAWSTLQRIDLARITLANTTRATLGATRDVVVASRAYPRAIKNVVEIVVDHQTFDSVFGDLGIPAADAAFVRDGAAVTPNLHALASRYALAGNFYADADSAPVGEQILVSGEATVFGETTMNPAEPVFASVDDPEDEPRIGSIFQAFARHNVPFRDYGGFLHLAGYDGTAYAYDVPAPAALAGHVDLGYPPAADADATDLDRAAAFERDYDARIADDALPRFAYVALPGTQAADIDAAVGAIVDHLSHLPEWRSTVVFVVAADTAGGADHVDSARAYALVVSPYAKRHFVGMRHLSTASVLKTVDGLFGMPALSLGDLLANDMTDFFTPAADLRPYVATPGAFHG